MIRAILIDAPSRIIQALDIEPSHLAVEEAIGTRFWLRRKIDDAQWHAFGPHTVLFHAEGNFTAGYEDFTFLGERYHGSALICCVDRYGDLKPTDATVENVELLVKWSQHPQPAWPFPTGHK